MCRIDGVMPEACRPAESFVLGRRDGIKLELHGGPNIGVVARDGDADKWASLLVEEKLIQRAGYRRGGSDARGGFIRSVFSPWVSTSLQLQLQAVDPTYEILERRGYFIGMLL